MACPGEALMSRAVPIVLTMVVMGSTAVIITRYFFAAHPRVRAERARADLIPNVVLPVACTALAVYPTWTGGSWLLLALAAVWVLLLWARLRVGA